MSATNTTTNLGLSQFVNTDVPAWRQDYNGDMLKIDNAYTADISGATAETSADGSDYMKFYDVSATTNKKILISDLLKGAKVEDLTDTDITTPTDNDGLVYDATAQKWENKQITTKEQWKKNGAYNLCNNTAITQTVSGITFTKNSDGSISVSGTAGASIEFDIFRVDGSIANSEFIANGKYRLVGCPSSSNDYSLKLRIDGTSMGKDSGSGLTYTCPSFSTLFKVFIAIENGTVITTPLVFKPMITTDLNATYDDYVPYAKTNRELTEDIKITTYTKTTDNTGECSIGSDSAYVPIGGSIVGTQNTHTGAISFRTASSDRNAYYAMFYSATSSALNVVANKELTFIVVWVKKA